MKTIHSIVAALALVATGTWHETHAGGGVVDFGKFTPGRGAEFIEVNINSNLIAMVTNFAKKDEPEVAEVLRGLKAIRVNVIGLNDANREEMTGRITTVRSQLEAEGWERIVTVMKDENDVGIFMKMRGEKSVEGLVVTVLDGNDKAIFVNIVGDIQPEKLTMVGERFDIEPLKHLPKKKESDQASGSN